MVVSLKPRIIHLLRDLPPKRRNSSPSPLLLLPLPRTYAPPPNIIFSVSSTFVYQKRKTKSKQREKQTQKERERERREIERYSGASSSPVSLGASSQRVPVFVVYIIISILSQLTISEKWDMRELVRFQTYRDGRDESERRWENESREREGAREEKKRIKKKTNLNRWFNIIQQLRRWSLYMVLIGQNNFIFLFYFLLFCLSLFGICFACNFSKLCFIQNLYFCSL